MTASSTIYYLKYLRIYFEVFATTVSRDPIKLTKLRWCSCVELPNENPLLERSGMPIDKGCNPLEEH